MFQQCFEEIFGDIKGVNIYIDDIRISARNAQEHNELLATVLERTRKINIKFNLEKYEISCKSLRYIDHIFSDTGIMVVPEKVEAIIKMKPPQNKAQLEKFLGTVTYVLFRI